MELENSKIQGQVNKLVITNHSVENMCQEIRSGVREESQIKEMLSLLGKENRWSEVWTISHALGVEISWIEDAKEEVWVDIGGPGDVSLEPPIGALLPFRLWVHTHPWDAYWSVTDRRTLAAYCGLIQEALVLGHDHSKHTKCLLPFGEKLKEGVSPLSRWTDEPCIPYGVQE